MKTKSSTDTMRFVNEDNYGITKLGAFVLDGSTGLTDRTFEKRGQDVVWMTKWWRDYLEKNLDDLSRTIQEIIKEGIKEFLPIYQGKIDLKKLKRHELLSAAIGVARVNGENLEVYVLGDVEIVIEDTNGRISAISDTMISYLDRQVINLMNSNPNRDNEILFKGFTKEELDLLIHNRSLMNTEEGYYILSTDVDAIDKGIYNEYQTAKIKRLYIASDGINPLYDRYTKYELLNNMQNRNMDSIIDELRELEDFLDTTKNAKQFKKHDDATVVYIEF